MDPAHMSLVQALECPHVSTTGAGEGDFVSLVSVLAEGRLRHYEALDGADGAKV